MHKHDDDIPVAHPDLQSAMLDATPDCIKILDLNGTLLAMSNAGCLALGVTKSQVKGSSWVALLPTSVHDAATEALAQALSGNTARFAGYSECSGKVTYWDNLLTPAADQTGKVSSIVCVSRDITEQTLLRRDLDRSLKREQLLSGEMLHRIKNLFSVVNAVVRMSDREARSVGGDGGLAKILTDKLGALARAYESVLAGPEMSNSDMKAFTGSVLNPFGSQCRFIGPQQQVPQELCQTLALFLHELATNSVKHGSLSSADGEVQVCWFTKEKSLTIEWREIGGPAVTIPTKQGFGTHMIDRLAESTGGAIARNWDPAGLHVSLKIPLGKA
ncbi:MULTISPECIES: PAS domain-containing protein [Pseudomonas]|uniref:PAS domain-containing protein n=1 Tax=Pseudomonas TaxID=286 RepID=UPI00398FA6E0